MPLYQYRTKDGEIIERVVSIEERDNQPDLERVLSFTGLVWSPNKSGSGGFA